MAQITCGEECHPAVAGSCFNPALCSIEKRCFRHDIGGSPPITEELLCVNVFALNRKIPLRPPQDVTAILVRPALDRLALQTRSLDGFVEQIFLPADADEFFQPG